MSDFVEENERIIHLDLAELPNSLVYKLEEIEYTFNPLKFGFDEYLSIEYYEKRFELAHPGLLDQFPCLYYMVEEWHAKAIERTPLEEIEFKKAQ